MVFLSLFLLGIIKKTNRCEIVTGLPLRAQACRECGGSRERGEESARSSPCLSQMEMRMYVNCVSCRDNKVSEGLGNNVRDVNTILSKVQEGQELTLD